MDVKTLIGKINATDEEIDTLIMMSEVRLRNAINKLEQNILVEFKNLGVGKDGLLMGPRINLKQSVEIHKQLLILFEQYFGTEAWKVSQEMARVAGIVQRNWPDLDEAIKFTGVDRDIIFALETQAHAELMNFANTARDKMVQAMYDTVISRAPYSVLLSTISDILKGGTESRGMSLLRYVNMWANDTVMNFHQWLTLKKGNDGGFEHYLYYGNIIKTSRDFCKQRAGKVFSKKEILSWNNLSWAGKSGPPLTHRGGYNCRHHWTPVRKEWVPEGEIEIQDFFKE